MHPSMIFKNTISDTVMTTKLRKLTPDDVELFDHARNLLESTFDPAIHQVAAALRTSTGKIYLGVHLGSRRINICAESSAIANATMAHDLDIRTMVAVCKDESGKIVVTNPCGVCRELMTTYGPNTDVIVDIQGEIFKVSAPELMPNPWMFPHENNWSLNDPIAQEEK